MSLIIETLLTCNGGRECPLDSPYGDGDNRCMTGGIQREYAKHAGWVQRGSDDYCPDCAKRFGYVKESK